MRSRFRRIAKPTVVVLMLGLAYLLFYRLTGLAIPCPVHRVFGIYCPGCGVSRMFFHLSQLEFAEAFSSNCVVFCLLPIGLCMFVYHACRYIRCGDGALRHFERYGIYCVIAVLLVFGLLRNIYPVDILVP